MILNKNYRFLLPGNLIFQLFFIHIMVFTSFITGLQAQSQGAETLFMDYKLPLEKRVDDLISRMTIDEKISQMGNEAPAIPRLKIQPCNWWNEALHGVMTWDARITVFPQAIGLASAWDPELILKVASAISDEARACNNMSGKGLTYWSPVVNIGRDPRWGRTQEGYGEDPYLASRIGVAFVKGLQGDDPKYLKTVATPKHFALNNTEYDRMATSADIDDRMLYEYYLPHFKACIQEGRAFSIMCAYNALNKVPCCANKRLLTDILRNEWGFDGYVVSDCGAVGNIIWTHHYAQSEAEASAMALLAGTDLNCGDTYQKTLKTALEQKLISEKDIDKALTRLFTARFRLGEFDPKEIVPYSKIQFSRQGKDIESSFLYPSKGKGNGLTAEYYNGTNFDEKAVERIDRNVIFNWGAGSPAEGVGKDNFSVRWTGRIKPGRSGEYTFITHTDDGVRLWVDGKLLIDDWNIHATAQNEGMVKLEAGKLYPIRMEYFESGGGAECRLKWEPPGNNDGNSKDIVDLIKNRELSRQAARESIVLLKNEKNLLPLDRKKIRRIAVIGPNASLCQIGDYSGNPYKPVSLLEGIKNKISEKDGIRIEYSTGCEFQSEMMKRIKFVNSLNDLFDIKNTSVKDNAFGAEFFNNKNLEGDPVLTRNDKMINFDWQQGSPDAKVNNNDFSARWTAQIVPKKTGTYWFKTTSDDGVRLFINGKMLIDSWIIRPAESDIALIELQSGEVYDLRMEYFQAGGGAAAKLETAAYEISPDPAKAAIETAKECDAVVFAAGLDLSYAQESRDLKDMNLPENQMDLLKQIYNVNPNVVVVLINGNPLTISWIKENIPSIIEAWYPGDEGGNAIADVLFGDYNPAGRLPITFYRTADELPDFNDYDIRKGRTYMYMRNEPLFPFGHGLSYTKFEYGNLSISPAKSKTDGTLEIKLNVKNTGELKGDEVIQLYIKKSVNGEVMPLKELKRFKRETFLAGETKEITFELPVSELSYYDAKNKSFRVEPGIFRIMAGASSSDIRLTGSVEITE
jgi:beta-glucosidase-like glycosyl hydrolase